MWMCVQCETHILDFSYGSSLQDLHDAACCLSDFEHGAWLFKANAAKLRDVQPLVSSMPQERSEQVSVFVTVPTCETNQLNKNNNRMYQPATSTDQSQRGPCVWNKGSWIKHSTGVFLSRLHSQQREAKTSYRTTYAGSRNMQKTLIHPVDVEIIPCMCENWPAGGYMKIQKINKVIWIHPLGTTNVSVKCNGS